MKQQNPTTGQIRSSSTDDIACWFLDTDYNSESFFARPAYLSGTDEPYEKLKRALRAHVTNPIGLVCILPKASPFLTLNKKKSPSRSSIIMEMRS
jgi:adenine-specific DNA-methyltransferase